MIFERSETVVNTSNGYDLNELLSALQKCIRRGMEYEAVHFAAELEEFSSPPLWSRLKTIASEDVGPANPLMPVLIETLAKRYYELRKDLTDTSHRLFLVNAVVCLCRSPKSRVSDDLLNLVYAEREFEHKKLPIPDFAIDMHTARGKAMGRGIETFFAEGNKIQNEAFPNPYTEKVKELLKKHRK